MCRAFDFVWSLAHARVPARLPPRVSVRIGSPIRRAPWELVREMAIPPLSAEDARLKTDHFLFDAGEGANGK